jgi:ribosomal protein S18 acetylase RimI-like enzyme
MNFYSEDIINDMIDKEEIENIIDKIDQFKETIRYLFHTYSFHTIHCKYTQYLLSDENVKYAFYCMDCEFSVYNCPSMMIYRKYNDYETNEIKYYILLICTKYKFRNQGYASKLLDGFIDRIKKQKLESKETELKKIKIILSSIEEAVLFYESHGFRWTREILTDHKLLMNYEKYEEGKEYFILELDIT